MKGKLVISLLMIWIGLAGCSLTGPDPIPLATPMPPSNPVNQVMTATAQATAAVILPSLNPGVKITELPNRQPPTTQPSPEPTPTRRPTVKPGGKISLKFIHMFTTNLGWAVGLGQPGDVQPVLRSVDGGKTWRDVSPTAASDGAQLAVHFRDEKNAWAIYTYIQPTEATMRNQVVWRTRDGGETWQSSRPLETQMMMEHFTVSDIGFRDDSFGWMLAHLGVGMHHDYVAIYTTQDGGINWKRIVDPELGNLPMSCYKHGLTFLDAQNGWVGGSCGGVMVGYYLYRTSDGGLTWSLEKISAPAGTNALFSSFESMCWVDTPLFQSSREGSFLLGCRMGERDTRAWLYRTTDGGASWKPFQLPVPYGTFDFLNPSRGWFLGSKSADSQAGSQIYVTANGGETWQVIASVNWTGQLNFIDLRTGWIVASAGDETALVRSLDGGSSWQLMNPIKAP